jgi:serine/threonine protein kinase
MPLDNSSALPIGYTLGEYKIEAVLGHGGFGITYLARDRQLGTKVAIKEYFPRSLASRGDNWVIHPLPGSDDAARNNFTWGLQQFLEEARALGHFKHNNIVRVLRFIEANGTAYMVMEFEEGQSLARQLVMRGGRVDEQSLLRVFVPILNGLQAVHDACLLHRDIKPDNIYLRLDGTPMLIDFGSVRQVTQAGGTDQPVVLTPAYAAIEQYPGQGEEGRWTDVYAIGASMYRCITGNPPIGGFQRYDAIRSYQPDPLTPLMELKPEGYSDFVLQCVDWAMQLYPRHRPRSARELQDGLMGIRKPDSAINALAVPAVTAVDSPDTASPAEDFDPVADAGSLDRFRIALVGMAALLLVAVISIWIVFSARHSPSSTSETQAVPTDSARSVPGVKSAVTATSPLLAVRHLRGSYNPLEATSFVPGTNLVVAASRGGDLIVWNIDNGQAIGTLNRHRRTVRVLEPLGRGSLVAAGDDGGNILVWDIARQKAVQRLDGHRGAVLAMAAAPDHRWLATGGRDQRVILWNLIEGGQNRVLATNLGRVSALAVSPNGRVIAAGTSGGIIHLLDSESGIARRRIDTNGGGIESLAFSGGGTLLAAGGISHSVSIWRSSDGGMAHRLRNPGSRAVYGLVFARDGRRLYVGDTGGQISLWDSHSGVKIATFPGHQGAVRDLGLTPDGHTLASAGADNMLILWAAH